MLLIAHLTLLSAHIFIWIIVIDPVTRNIIKYRSLLQATAPARQVGAVKKMYSYEQR